MNSAPRQFFINGRFLEQSRSGVQRFAREIVRALDRWVGQEGARAGNWTILSTGRETDAPALDHIAIRPLLGRLRGHAWEQTALLRAARSGTLLSLAGSGPVFHRRQIVVIHDANVYRNRDLFSARYGAWHRSIGHMLARRARIATVSQFSKDELSEVLGLSPNSIPVFYNGSEHMREITPSDACVDSLDLADRPYFVALGNLTRNKNLVVAARALAQVPEALLVVIGANSSRVFGAGDGQLDSNRVILAGRVDDEGVAGLLRQAKALIFPSLYEGFGIPPLEAMVNGCAVIASDIPPVREVCGDNALRFPPDDPEALAAQMRVILQETAVERETRIAAGQQRARTFSWDRSGRQLGEFCLAESLAGSPRRP